LEGGKSQFERDVYFVGNGSLFVIAHVASAAADDPALANQYLVTGVVGFEVFDQGRFFVQHGGGSADDVADQGVVDLGLSRGGANFDVAVADVEGFGHSGLSLRWWSMVMDENFHSKLERAEVTSIRRQPELRCFAAF